MIYWQDAIELFINLILFLGDSTQCYFNMVFPGLYVMNIIETSRSNYTDYLVFIPALQQSLFRTPFRSRAQSKFLLI